MHGKDRVLKGHGRTAGAAAMAALLLTGSAALAAVPPPAEAPAMFRGGPALTGVYPGPAPRRLTGVRFSFDARAPLRGAPAIAGGTAYFGAADGSVFAIGAGDGALHWKTALPAPVTSSPAVTGDAVLVTARDEAAYALSRRDGHILWRKPLGAHLGTQNYWDFYTSSVTIADGTAYLGSGAGVLYALDPKTGRQIWRAEAGSPIRSTPAVSGELVVFGTQSGQVAALDRKTGAERWRFATEGASHSFALKHNDTTSVFASPTIADGVVAVGGRDGFLYGLELATGRQLWRTTQNGSSWILSTAAEGGELIVGGGSALIVQGADLKTGAERWRFATASAVFGSPTLAGGVVLADDLSGRLYALDQASGRELWRFGMGDKAFSTPVIAAGVVYAASDDGILYALDTAPGDAAAATAPPRRLVYRAGKASAEAFAWFDDDFDQTIFAGFKDEGYEAVDAAGLRQAMEDQVSAGKPSLVVFADSHVPEEVLGSVDDHALLRRYLEAGGKVVFLSGDPVLFRYDGKTGALTGFDDDRAQAILGLRLPPRPLDYGYHVSHVTPEGRRWGLDGYYSVSGVVADDQVDVVLGRDEFGMATSWAKRYGGPRGGWLLQLPAPKSRPFGLAPYRNAIDHAAAMGVG